MYNWRKMSDENKARLLKERKARKLPWHSPPHLEYEGDRQFIVTAACYEHRLVIGKSADRMAESESSVFDVCEEFAAKLYAWCVLPNHYHTLIRTDKIKEFQKGLGKFHGRSSYRWNGEDEQRGRKVWYRSFERPMKSDRHFFASLNYIHNNAVKHGYVSNWQDWPFSSARQFLDDVGRERALEIWREYPVWIMGRAGILAEHHASRRNSER